MHACMYLCMSVCMYVSIYLSMHVSIYVSMCHLFPYTYAEGMFGNCILRFLGIWFPPKMILQTARLPALQGAAPKASDPQEHSPCEEVPWFSRTEKSCRELGSLTFSRLDATWQVTSEDKIYQYYNIWTDELVWNATIICLSQPYITVPNQT